MKHKLHKKLVALQMIAITSLLSISQVFAMTGFDEVTTVGKLKIGILILVHYQKILSMLV